MTPLGAGRQLSSIVMAAGEGRPCPLFLAIVGEAKNLHKVRALPDEIESRGLADH